MLDSIIWMIKIFLYQNPGLCTILLIFLNIFQTNSFRTPIYNHNNSFLRASIIFNQNKTIIRGACTDD